MEVFEAIKKRRSVREFKADPVPEEKLKRILEAARLAPSAHNEQEWKFIVVRDFEKRKKLAKAALNQDFIAQAPLVIVALSTNPTHIMTNEVPAYAVDLAIAIEHMVLQAVEEGLGTCWIGAFSQKEVKEILEIPKEYKVVTLMPLGFPADSPRKKIRKKLEEIVSYDRYQ